VIGYWQAVVTFQRLLKRHSPCRKVGQICALLGLPVGQSERTETIKALELSNLELKQCLLELSVGSCYCFDLLSELTLPHFQFVLRTYFALLSCRDCAFSEPFEQLLSLACHPNCSVLLHLSVDLRVKQNIAQLQEKDTACVDMWSIFTAYISEMPPRCKLSSPTNPAHICHNHEPKGYIGFWLMILTDVNRVHIYSVCTYYA